MKVSRFAAQPNRHGYNKVLLRQRAGQPFPGYIIAQLQMEDKSRIYKVKTSKMGKSNVKILERRNPASRPSFL